MYAIYISHKKQSSFIVPDIADNPWHRTEDTGRFAFICRWPITLLLWLTIPDCRKYPKLRALTFFMCIVWIGITSYLVAFLITVFGKFSFSFFFYLFFRLLLFCGNWLLNVCILCLRLRAVL